MKTSLENDSIKLRHTFLEKDALPTRPNKFGTEARGFSLFRNEIAGSVFSFLTSRNLEFTGDVLPRLKEMDSVELHSMEKSRVNLEKEVLVTL